MSLLNLADAFLDGELDERAAALLPALTTAALIARRAGVRPTLRDLTRSTVEREAWIAAGVRYDLEQAVDLAQRVAIGIRAPLGPALVQADLDGGDAHDRALTETAARLIAAREAATHGL